MKKSSRSQQSEFTKSTIRKAKKMVDDGFDYKAVMNFLKEEYEAEAQNTGFFDNIQYNKATKSVIDYM
jgi:hypothetical protein